MNLYIQTENEQPINHPAFEDNLIQAFGSVPSNWEAFVRVEKPIPTIYQVLDNQEPIYQKINDVWTDVWGLRNMTADEKAAKQQAAKDLWKQRPNFANFSAWTFDDATCTYIPPIPRPTDNKIYRWDGATNAWVEFVPPIIT